MSLSVTQERARAGEWHGGEGRKIASSWGGWNRVGESEGTLQYQVTSVATLTHVSMLYPMTPLHYFLISTLVAPWLSLPSCRQCSHCRDNNCIYCCMSSYDPVTYSKFDILFFTNTSQFYHVLWHLHIKHYIKSGGFWEFSRSDRNLPQRDWLYHCIIGWILHANLLKQY